ncbi:MAG TPA: ABC transporter permease [bacterium]|jgi:peptide/nickel transport system permease protein|nr:ABC transporter permease [bacterium]
MGRYLGRRLIELIPVFFGVLLVVFAIAHLTPGDPALVMLGERATPEAIERLRDQLGLDEPLHVQFFRYMGRVVRGDLGESIQTDERVIVELGQRFPATVELTLAAMLVASLVGMLTGAIAAARQNSWFDGASMVVALFGFSMPIFWLGIMMILLFAATLGWFPISGRLDFTIDLARRTNLYVLDGLLSGNWAAVGNALRHLVLPAVTLSTVPLAIIARMTRSSLLEVLRQDYVRTARAKGLAETRVVTRHALRNAAIPVVTVIGLNVGSLLGGAILTETIFAWPGVGRLVVDAIFARDYPLVQGAVLMIALIFVVVNLLVDLSYVYLDPRIRYG